MPKTGFLAQWEIINPNICVHKKNKINQMCVSFFLFFLCITDPGEVGPPGVRGFSKKKQKKILLTGR
jgi:hypothetical protein